MTLEPARMLLGTNVLRIVWVPGTDRLRGVCHCGASLEEGDPAVLWEWLLAHPIGHRNADEPCDPVTPCPDLGCLYETADRYPTHA
ncbi:hypothetical protein CH295_25840 [Rhodococcus sp. 14-2483-1-2]|nr:hypothetical protein CH295_25840 [Rhodococcus sp. 14-2483-1-2]